MEALAGAGRVTSLPARWTVVHEGTPADACFVLLVGVVCVRIDGVTRATLGPGEVVGEMGLLGRSLRSASVVTQTPMQALRIEYDALSALMGARPALSRCMGTVYDEHRAG